VAAAPVAADVMDDALMAAIAASMSQIDDGSWECEGIVFACKIRIHNL
jgi:hypothetical protein